MRRLRLLALVILVCLAASGILGAASNLAAGLGTALTAPGTTLSEAQQAHPVQGAAPSGGPLSGLNRMEGAWAGAQWRILQAAARLARGYLEQTVVPRLEAAPASPSP